MSNFKIKFLPRANKEIEESFDWYLSKSNIAAVNFLEMIDKRVEEIRQYPKRYAIKKYSFRETKVLKYPFSIIYEILEEKNIVAIHSVFHLKRNPKAKYKIK